MAESSVKKENLNVDAGEVVVRTICDSHCLGSCEIKVHVKDNRIVRLEPIDGESLRHRPCAKGLSYIQRVYAPDRLLYPIKRTGERGSGEFTRVSWDEALYTVAEQMIRVRDVYGNAAIMHFCSMCDAFTLNHVPAFHRLLCQFGGYTAPWGTISNEGLNFAMGMTYGTAFGLERTAEDYENSPLIIMWCWNPAVTQQGSEFPEALACARQKGAKIIVVDPKFSNSAAAFARQWIPIRPGTDVAVLSAMAYVVINENLYDRDFIDSYVSGFPLYRDYIMGVEDDVKKTPHWAEAVSGVRAAVIENLAREYASTKNAILNAGFSAGRTAFGEQFHRAISTLEAITGHSYLPNTSPGSSRLLKIVRNSIQFNSPPNMVEKGAARRWNALPYRGNSVNSSARVNVSSFADAIMKGKAGGYPGDYKFLWLSNTNYLNQLGDINKAAEAFKHLDFVLVTEQFMSTTAKFADIILPVCTYLERNDIYTSRDSDYYGFANKAIEPLGESRSQLQICEALAARLGIPDFNDKSDEEWMRQITRRLAEEVEIPAFESLKQQGPQRLKNIKTPAPPVEDPGKPVRLFPTPTGKIEIYSQIIADMGHPDLPPVPKYIETWESTNDPQARLYPLQLVTSHYSWRVHSQYHNLPWLQELQKQVLNISSYDAESRSIKNGDMVRIYNSRGEVRVPANVTDRIMPGVVDLPEGAWYSPDNNGVDYGGCPNVLTSNKISPGGAFTCNTSLVQVERLK